MLCFYKEMITVTYLNILIESDYFLEAGKWREENRFKFKNYDSLFVV